MKNIEQAVHAWNTASQVGVGIDQDGATVYNATHFGAVLAGAGVPQELLPPREYETEDFASVRNRGLAAAFLRFWAALLDGDQQGNNDPNAAQDVPEPWDL